MDEPLHRAVNAHGRTVLRVCRSLVGYTGEAEDAWSETFLAALQAWPALPADTNVEAWLVHVAKRKCIDILRNRAKTVLVPDGAPGLEGRTGFGAEGEVGPPAPSAGIVDPAEKDLDLWRAVQELPRGQRTAILLHYWAGLKHTETAGLTGSTPAAVRRSAADGIASLRRNPAWTHQDGHTNDEREEKTS